jgi:hypothetical protein
MASSKNWSRPLPRQLVIPTVMTLKTLADVRTLIGHVPKERRKLETWQYVEDTLDKAARGAPVVDVAVALRMVLMLEGVECRAK